MGSQNTGTAVKTHLWFYTSAKVTLTVDAVVDVYGVYVASRAKVDGPPRVSRAALKGVRAATIREFAIGVTVDCILWWTVALHT